LPPLRRPADCVDYAVVSPEAGREVSRVWKEEDARFQAAASPARISRLVRAYRDLEEENRKLKTETSPRTDWEIAQMIWGERKRAPPVSDTEST
jgi:hypothetical protein